MAEYNQQRATRRYAKQKLRKVRVKVKPLIKHREIACKCEKCLVKRRVRLGSEVHVPFEKRKISFPAYKELEEREKLRSARPARERKYRAQEPCGRVAATKVVIAFIISLGKEGRTVQ